MSEPQGIFARVVADSVCAGNRITTMHVRMPRIILAEFNTHRGFSRNSASSRAVPTAKFRDRVRDNPYFPEKWLLAGKGMTPAGPMPRHDSEDQGNDIRELLELSLAIHERSEDLYGTAKEQLNRYLEPWLFTDVLVTATDYRNFFLQRCDGAADKAMQRTADAMLEAYVGSTPLYVEEGDWHLPMSHPEDDRCNLPLMDRLKSCTARCARVSYFNFGDESTVPDHAKDLATHDKLLASGHWSPFEHCARALPACGRRFNFTGWCQYRWDFRNTVNAHLSALDLNALLEKRRATV